jgi:hypothetical protein
MLTSAVEAGVIGRLVIEESAFGAFAVVRRFVAFFGGVCEEVAALAL